MLQADKSETPTIKLYDFLIISPFAWVISQSALHGNLLWLGISYCFFLQYAYMRREYYDG